MYGEIIRRLRKEKKLTQKDLAQILGFDSSSTIAMIEREERKPTMDTLERLSKFFKVSIDYILGKTIEIYSGELDQLEQDVKAMSEKMKNISPSDREKLMKMIEIFESENLWINSKF